MKILILTPVYKRPEIFRIFLDGYQRLKKHYEELTLLCILSPQDQFFKLFQDWCLSDGVEFCYFNNDFLGRKKIAGLNYAIKHYEFDYMMEMGSDDLINPALLDLYYPYMEQGIDFFGINNLYFVDWRTKKTIFVKNYNPSGCFGVGRMLKNDAIRVHPWPEEASEGLDTAMSNILLSKGVRELVIDVGEKPYVLDIKTNTSVSHWTQVYKFKSRDVEFNDICGYFGLPQSDNRVQELVTWEGFISHFLHYKTFCKPSVAYEETEQLYISTFGKRRYKNYASFSRVLRRKTIKH